MIHMYTIVILIQTNIVDIYLRDTSFYSISFSSFYIRDISFIISLLFPSHSKCMNTSAIIFYMYKYVSSMSKPFYHLTLHHLNNKIIHFSTIYTKAAQGSQLKLPFPLAF